MVENEFKVMLTAEQYEKICSMFSWDSEVEQTNFYYDTPGLQLSSAHITCRVRRIGGECFLQMKLPNGKAFSRIELERNLGSEVPQELSAQLLNDLSGGSISEPLPQVRLLGALTTLRRVKKSDGAEIDLDKSSYFQKTDYELEIEFTDEAAARALLAEIRSAAALSGGDVCMGKIHRFLREYKASQK